MKIFELSYIRHNNGETGVASSYNIAQSTNEEVILDIINKNHLNYLWWLHAHSMTFDLPHN